MFLVHAFIGVAAEWHSLVMPILQTIFSPSFFGGVVFVVYILAWYRMEVLARRRRELVNKPVENQARDLPGPGTESDVVLEDYVQSQGGDNLFSHNPR